MTRYAIFRAICLRFFFDVPALMFRRDAIRYAATFATCRVDIMLRAAHAAHARMISASACSRAKN